MRRLLALALSMSPLAATLGEAQEVPNAVEAIRRLAHLVGEWRGAASVVTGPGRAVEAAQREVVALAAGGTVLTITGLGTVIENGTERVIHDAFATIWWDAEASRYRMRAHLANGQAIDAEPVLRGDTLVWGFRHPQAGHIRYTVTRTAAGDWHEIGERSTDGTANWMRFIEMRLTKAAIAP